MIAPHFWRESKAKIFKRDLFFVTTPWWLRKLYPGCTWDIKTTEKIIYLSFDDGPHPTITPFVLEQLKKYNAKATFFCIGDNVKKYPRIFHEVINEGHAVGNHTMQHINGWKSTDEAYTDDINRAKTYIKSNLFRPPYGRIKRSQINELIKFNQLPVAATRKHQIIMWSVLAGDWVQDLSPQKCYEKVKNNIHPGSIVVFHDSDKAYHRMSYALPKVLEHFTEKGYIFKAIDISQS